MSLNVFFSVPYIFVESYATYIPRSGIYVTLCSHDPCGLDGF